MAIFELLRRWLVAVTVLALTASCAGSPRFPDPPPDAIRPKTAVSHLLTHRSPIRAAGVSLKNFSVDIELVVDPLGNVTAARPLSGPSSAYAAVVKEAMTWKFRPFHDAKQQPVTAVVETAVSIIPFERKPRRHVSFPAVGDISKVRITLDRSGCEGTCPAYEVVIEGEGTVTFDGDSDSYAVASGKHRSQISTQAVAELVERFRRADWFSLDDEYEAGVVDFPIYKVSIVVDGKSKTVIDDWGAMVGMPQAVTELQDAIDDVAGTDRWVKGTDETITILKREGFDFHSVKASNTLALLANQPSITLVRAMMAEGATFRDDSLSQRALCSAKRRQDKEMTDLLIGDGVTLDQHWFSCDPDPRD